MEMGRGVTKQRWVYGGGGIEWRMEGKWGEKQKASELQAEGGGGQAH